MTFFLKFSGAPEANTAALKAAHPDMVAKDEEGKDVLRSIYTHDIALHYDDQMPAGPFVMVRFFDGQSLAPLPPGLVKEWVSGGAPVMWAGA